MTPALLAELRHAATVIRDAVAGGSSIDSAALASAHNTLIQRRHHTGGPVRDAIDHYLDDDTWHQGPIVLRHAGLQLARELGIAAPPEPDQPRWVQPRLFEPPDDRR